MVIYISLSHLAPSCTTETNAANIVPFGVSFKREKYIQEAKCPEFTVRTFPPPLGPPGGGAKKSFCFEVVKNY